MGDFVGIRKHAPEDRELHNIANALYAVQLRNRFQITADGTHRGRYCHEYTMDITVSRNDSQAVAAEDERQIVEVFRDLARWLHRQLEREYEHQTSDETVGETILANEYTFLANGRRFG